MNDRNRDLRTDPTVLAALKKAATTKVTANEIAEQRISFVYGAMNASSAITREQVKKIVVSHDLADSDAA